jgi:hypothetical protein
MACANRFFHLFVGAAVLSSDAVAIGRSVGLLDLNALARAAVEDDADQARGRV